MGDGILETKKFQSVVIGNKQIVVTEVILLMTDCDLSRQNGKTSEYERGVGKCIR